MSGAIVSDQSAINAALSQDWKEAIRVNTELLKHDKANISFLNRLGFAYLQSGQLTLAKKTFQKVMKLDPYNQIASKNSKKLSSVRQKDMMKTQKNQVTPLSFLEEPGKTKIVECVNVAPIQALSCICPGEEVTLHAKNHAIEVRSSSKHTYLAALPDDLSFRLIKFMAVGNTYQALVKSVGKNSLTVFLRELSRGKRFTTQPSFATTAMYVPFTRTDRTTDDTSEHETDSKEGENEE